MFSYLIKNLVIGGPQSIGFMLDAFLATLIFTGLVLFGINLVMSNKFNAKEKLSTIGTPGAILVLSLILGLIANSYRIS
jgi:hypothetical protein